MTTEAHRDEGLAREIMEGFGARPGLSREGPQRRYLWTDAFAPIVCTTCWRGTGRTTRAKAGSAGSARQRASAIPRREA